LIRLFVVVLAAAVALAFVVSLTRDDDDDSSASNASAVSCSTRKPDAAPTTEQFDAPPEMTIDPTATYEVVMHTSCGAIPITLDAATAPATVNSFVTLAKDGFYDGTTFHRIVTDFVDQGGDPSGDGTGGPGYTLPDEPPAGPYQKGDVAMANSGAGTTGSQFFLVVSDSAAQTLTSQGTPGKYSILGRMSKDGLKVARKINTFGGADTAGTPSRAIYVFSVDVSGPTASSSTTTTAAP
jgi:cyclophilin family peptidyl-prolyl cis-trans isomerase